MVYYFFQNIKVYGVTASDYYIYGTRTGNEKLGQRKKIGECIIYGENDEISSLIDSFEKLMDSLKEHAIQKYELKLAYTKAELRTMQAQINPHFIYNVY